MTSGAVLRWGREIQEGIYDMLQLFVDLVSTRLRYEPVPVELLNVLALAFTPETEFHTKNKEKKPDKAYFEEKFGSGQCFAASPSGLLKSSVSKISIYGLV
jgi:ubiquitin carboxyl-terminal hydrolase 9/24